MGTKKIDVSKLPEHERAIIEARRAYKKAWRAANKDKVAEYSGGFLKRNSNSKATVYKQSRPTVGAVERLKRKCR